MSKGIFTAVSGAMAQSARLDTVANNLANVNTPGFKRDSQVFREYLTSYNKEPGTIEVPRVPASIESFYAMNGGDKSYVDIDGTSSDFSQGTLKTTGNTLDLAIEGEGFFEVATPEGLRFTRSGNFSVDGEGRLVTKQGFPVQRQGGGEFQFAGADVNISANGEVFEAGQSLGFLSLVTVENKDALLKQGANLFALKENYGAQSEPAASAKIHQGFLEGSNVNIIREMTDMIAATRTFESTQKAIQAYDQMNGKVVNEVPKLNQG
ncbi:MAG: flagellar basal-body rod protein FlgF [Bdellovibrionales bacterium]|jgi:flagellar basal-body rod protein FlgG|nr:flagellar basal-body rod protein FlgF [Bdellovibrionales bacterium]